MVVNQVEPLRDGGMDRIDGIGFCGGLRCYSAILQFCDILVMELAALFLRWDAAKGHTRMPPAVGNHMATAV